MLPWETVARAAGPDGAEWVLARRGDEWVVRVAGRALMSSRQHGSEEALAAIALARMARARELPAPPLRGGAGQGEGAGRARTPDRPPRRPRPRLHPPRRPRSAPGGR